MNTAEYLLKQLEKLGITDIFGLPGDYNFDILYAIESTDNMRWIGCTNELNAGYAADGYAREKGYGAILTTYGVGELSAANAIAGSYAEHIPVIHIVGAPATKVLDNKKLVHHTFENHNKLAFMEAFKPITEAAAFLNRDNAKIEIDRLIKVMVKEKRPVYIAIPSDIATMEISDRKVDIDWRSDEKVLSAVTHKIIEKISKANKPVILADTLIQRYDSKDIFIELVNKSGIPATNFLMGTNIIDYDTPNYLGSYFSTYDNPLAEKYMNETDCLIAVGAMYGDFNSYGMKLPYDINSHIAIYGTYTYIDGKKYDNIKMSDVLTNVVNAVEHKDYPFERQEIGYPEIKSSQAKLTSKYIYPRVQEMLKEGDIIYAEAGIVPHGFTPMKFPKGVELNTQSLWCSIGWATAATFGACIAKPDKTVILFTGEGAHQISAMEIGNMLRFGLKPVIVVINNGGYTIERLLCNDPNDNLNEIMQLDFAKFARAFKGDIWSSRVETEEDFDKAMRVTQIMKKLCYIEAVTDKMDYPELTDKVVNALKSAAGAEKTPAKKKSKKVVLSKPDKPDYGTNVHLSLSEIDK